MRSIIKKIQNDKYLLNILIIGLINIIIHLPFAKTPAYWDEVNYFSCATAIFKNNLNPFVNCWGYKPPAMFEPVSIFFKVFYPSMFWGRFYIYLFSSLSIVFCFLLGRKIFNEKVGFSGSVLLLFFPLFTAQSFLYQDAIPVTAFSLMTLYFYFSNKKTGYLISSSLLVLTKEPMVLIPIIIFLFDLIDQKAKNSGVIIKNKSYLLFPVLILFLWMLINKIFLGWFLWPLNVGLFAKDLKLMLDQARISFAFSYIFASPKIIQYFFIIILFCLSFIKENRSKIILFLITIVIYFLFYFFTALLARYLLFIYPLIFLCFFYYLNLCIKNKKIFIVVFLLSIFVFINSNYQGSNNKVLAGDDDLSFFREIALNKESINFVEKEYRDKTIITTWPMVSFYQEPFLGYVNSKFNVIDFADPSQEKKYKQSGVIYIQSTKEVEPYVEITGLNLIRIFDTLGEEVKIYEVK